MPFSGNSKYKIDLVDSVSEEDIEQCLRYYADEDTPCNWIKDWPCLHMKYRPLTVTVICRLVTTPRGGTVVSHLESYLYGMQANPCLHPLALHYCH